MGEYQGITKAKMADEVARIVQLKHFGRILHQFISSVHTGDTKEADNATD